MLRLAWAPFDRSFIKPFATAGQTWQRRQGFILRAEFWDGNTRYAEASPLPGFSRESYIHVENFFREENLGAFLEQGHELSLLPSLQFAYDSLMDHAEKLTEQVESNAVFSVQEKGALSVELDRAWEQGYRTFKLKLGPHSWAEIFPLLQSWSGRVKLRLDSNGSFSWPELKEVASKFKDLKIEYWEDPLAEPLALPVDFSSIRFVRDQGISSWGDWQEFLESKAYAGAVIKPMVVGGFSICRKGFEYARSCNKICSFSSALESEVGRRSHLKFLFSLQQPLAAGLSTGHLYLRDQFPDQAFFKSVPEFTEELNTRLGNLAWRELRT